MRYKQLGKTGVKISTLGFGAMRLPEYEKNGKWYIDEDRALEIIHRAFDLGVNYIDTAYGYCHGNSEYTVGRALKGYRDSVFLSTKIPTHRVKEKDDYRRLLEEQLDKLGQDYIDFYHFHGLNKKSYEQIVLKYDLLDEAIKAKQEGLIKHISFSFHDKPEVMKELVDTGVFETVLCQYNLLDRSNEEAIAYACRKGVGTVVMGPVGGGRLAFGSDLLMQNTGREVKSTPELAIRFVTANPNVCCALSGMNTIEMVEENARTASLEQPLSEEEIKKLDAMLEETKQLADLYCTGCSYCMPCPQDINIPQVFKTMIYHKVYGLTEYARQNFKNFGRNNHGAHPSECIECRKCIDKCPQDINIPQRLKEVITELGQEG